MRRIELEKGIKKRNQRSKNQLGKDVNNNNSIQKQTNNDKTNNDKQKHRQIVDIDIQQFGKMGCSL